MKWTALIMSLWTAVLGTSAFQSQVPASWYFEPQPLHIENAKVGQCPPIRYDREINRDFYANWTVTIERRRPTGGFWSFKTYGGGNDYSPAAVTPPDPDLCWWTWDDKLLLPEGEYRVRTLWMLDVPGGVKEIRRGSNVFRVAGY